VTYNSAAEQMCAVTVRSSAGARVFMEVTLDTWPSGNAPAKDSGSYTTYAGPVYKHLPEPGVCMTWSGSVDIYYNSDNGLCP
jgi:hypothetical protein